MLDVLHAMEKRGILESYYSWKRLRELRNAFMHDYANEEDLKAAALTEAYGKAAVLFELLDRFRKYATENVGLDAVNFPEVPR